MPAKVGRTTREHILHMKHLLPQYPEIDAVILLIGLNDLSLRLSQGDTYDPNYSASPATMQALIERAFYWLVKPDPYRLYYEQSATWRLVRANSTVSVTISKNSGRC